MSQSVPKREECFRTITTAGWTTFTILPPTHTHTHTHTLPLSVSPPTHSPADKLASVRSRRDPPTVFTIEIYRALQVSATGKITIKTAGTRERRLGNNSVAVLHRQTVRSTSLTESPLDGNNFARTFTNKDALDGKPIADCTIFCNQKKKKFSNLKI